MRLAGRTPCVPVIDFRIHSAESFRITLNRSDLRQGMEGTDERRTGRGIAPCRTSIRPAGRQKRSPHYASESQLPIARVRIVTRSNSNGKLGADNPFSYRPGDAQGPDNQREISLAECSVRTFQWKINSLLSLQAPTNPRKRIASTRRFWWNAESEDYLLARRGTGNLVSVTNCYKVSLSFFLDNVSYLAQRCKIQLSTRLKRG